MGETLNLIESVSGGFPSYFCVVSGLRPNEFLRIVVAEAVLTRFLIYLFVGLIGMWNWGCF